MAGLGRTGWTVFGAALALSLALVMVGWHRQPWVNNSSDPYYFSAMGTSLAHGHGLVPFGNMIHRRAPLYPLMIGAIYAVVGDRPLAVKLFQCLLFACLCVTVWAIGRRLFNERTGVIAAAACTLHPLLLRYVADFQLEILLTFLFTLAVFGTIAMYERPTTMAGIWTGVCFGLAALTKAVVVLYPVLFAVGLVLHARSERGRASVGRAPIAALAAMFAAMVVVILPWTVRNYMVTGRAIPISTGLSDAFLRGYIFSEPDYALLRRPPYTYAENASNALFRQLAHTAGTEWERDDVETDRILNSAAREKLLSDPGGFVRKFMVGLFTFWYEMTNRANSAVAGGAALIAWIFALAGWLRCRREARPAWLLLMPVLYLNILLAALLALGRYAAPITPALVVLAAFGLDGLLAQQAAVRPSEPEPALARQAA